MPKDDTLTVLDADTLQPEEEVAQQKVNSNAVLPRYASHPASTSTPTTDADVGDCLRLIQLQPAWALHFMVRFRGLAYRCENSMLPYSMGQALPMLVDGHYLWTECDALTHLSSFGSVGGDGDSSQDSDVASSSSSSLIGDTTNVSPQRLQAWVAKELSGPLQSLRQLSGDNARAVGAAVGGKWSPYGLYWRLKGAISAVVHGGQRHLLAELQRLPLPDRVLRLLGSCESAPSGGAGVGRTGSPRVAARESGGDATPQGYRRQQEAVDAYIDANTKPVAPSSAAAVTSADGGSGRNSGTTTQPALASSPLNVAASAPEGTPATASLRPFPALDCPTRSTDTAFSTDAAQLALAQQLQAALRELDGKLERGRGMLSEVVRCSAAEAELCGSLLGCMSCPAGRAAVNVASHKYVHAYLQAMCTRWFQSPTGEAQLVTSWSRATVQLLDNCLVDQVLRSLMLPKFLPVSELEVFAMSTPAELDATPAKACTVWFRPPVIHSPVMRLYRWICDMPLPLAEPLAPANPWLSEISPFGVATLATAALSFTCYAFMAAGWAGIPTNVRLPELHLLVPSLKR